jgi:N-acetyl-1-D-myo-inositol-2-amino-2-deoxy-alpha-D-glucopyranoside deacetylase
VTSPPEPPASEPRLLLVHAHPDDESIYTGATMAKYAAEGARVTLVTCTLGELGEIIPPRFAHLAAGREDRLGQHRIGELDAACRALGVTDHRFLGGPGRWRDSGMIGTPDNDDPRCFWRADLNVAARDLAAVIREVRPQVLVTYDADGFYGHPDHIQAHRVSRRAVRQAADPAATVPAPADTTPPPPWQVSKFYATAMPLSALTEGIEAVRAGAAGGQGRVATVFDLPGSVTDFPFGVPDDQVTTEIDGSEHLPAKLAAMRAHATQIDVDGGFFALSNNVAQRVSAIEYYTLLSSYDPGGPAPGDRCREHGLFDGITTCAATRAAPARIPDDATARSAG